MRLIRFALALALICTILLGQSLAPRATSYAQEETLPRFEEARCAFNTSYIDADVECGYLVVPEDRSDPASHTIRLHVALIHSNARSPEPDPLLLLEGGPGMGILEGASFFVDILEPILQSRDVIMVDQRGTGFSQPNLACPEYTDQVLADLISGQKMSKALMGSVEGMLACQDRLIAQGVNIASYNTLENAADIADLRQVLGYKAWNIYGVSYGTRLAMTVMNMYPQGVRSVVLDSAYPPMADLYYERSGNVYHALENMFSECAASSWCSRQYPNLENVFYGVVEELNATPVLVESWDYTTYESMDVVLTGDLFAWMIGNFLRSGPAVSILPDFIFDVAAANYSEIGYLLGSSLIILDSISYGMYLSVQCSEAIPFSVFQPGISNPEVSPAILDSLDPDSAFIFGVCAHWQTASADPSFVLPISSEIPTMVLAGAIDPTTPPEWGQMTADMLINSYYFEFPATGHGVISISDSCPVDMIYDFLDHPRTEPDSSCILRLPGLFD